MAHDGVTVISERPIQDTGPHRPLPGSEGVAAVARAIGIQPQSYTVIRPVPKLDLR